MSDFNPIKTTVLPAWPIKPVQPSRKDREQEREPRDRPVRDEEGTDDDDETLIDEYV